MKVASIRTTIPSTVKAPRAVKDKVLCGGGKTCIYKEENIPRVYQVDHFKMIGFPIGVPHLSL